MTIIDILLIILLVVSIVLAVYLIFALKKIVSNVEKIQKDAHDLYERSLPLIDELSESSAKFNSIANRADEQISNIESYVEKLRENFLRVKDRIENAKKENPAYDIYRNLNAISKGISAFWNRLKHK